VKKIKNCFYNNSVTYLLHKSLLHTIIHDLVNIIDVLNSVL